MFQQFDASTQKDIKVRKNWTFKIKWLIKADDDVAINAELLAEKLTDLKPFDQIYCHIRWFAQPNRKEGSKW